MNGLGVKVQISGCLRRVVRPACALVFMATLALVGCAKSPTKAEAPAVAPAPPPQPGTTRWAGGALHLPKGTPAVAVARLGEVLGAAERAKAWLVAEPAMFGENGEETARSITFGWKAATAYLGLDPFRPSAWAERGVDPTRPIYAGVYPIGEEGQKFNAAVDTTLRHTMGLPPGERLAASIRTMRRTTEAFPEGTNAEILRSVEGLNPLGGLRVVIPTTSSQEFLTTAASFAAGLGYTSFPESIDTTRIEGLELALWSKTGGVPALAVRMRGDHALLDILFPAFAGGPLSTPDVERTPEQSWDELRRVLAEVELGRPDAPKPVHMPAVAVAFDQHQMSEFVKLRGYRASLEQLQVARASNRDALLLEQLETTVAESEIWDIASDELTGTTFELEVGNDTSEIIGRASMTLFGSDDLKPLDGRSTMPSLGVDDRAAAVGISFEALRRQAWLSWFAVDTADELKGVDFGPTDILRIGLPAVRVLTVAGSNLGDTDGVQTFSKHLAEVMKELEGVRRFELIGLSSNVTDFGRNPRLLAAFVLSGDESIATAELARHELRRILLEWFEVDSSEEKLPLMKAGVTGTSELADLGTLRHHVSLEGDPVALFGIGLSDEEFESELAAMRSREVASEVLQGRVEPITLLTWIRADDPNRFKPLDLDILAQRLGPLTMSYERESVEDADGVTLGITLDSPPRL